MDKDIKRHIMNVMKGGTGGCKHLEMSQALNCSICKMKMIRARSEYDRLRKEYPEKFIRKEEYDDTKSQLLNEQLQHRINNDSLYYKHNRILQSGKPEEKLKEIKKFWSGFYEKNVGDWRRKTIR